MVVGCAVSKEWSFDVKYFGKVRVSLSLIKKLGAYRQLKSGAVESGGVLIGKHLNSDGALLINQLTPPQRTDRQGRCLYYRSEVHNDLVRRIWKESNYHSTYVGLWHTHPELNPNFSPIDKEDWLNAISHSKYEGKRLFFIIVGQAHVRIWMGVKRQLLRNKIVLVGEYEFEN